MLHNIDQEMLKCIELDERLKAMDQEITVNPSSCRRAWGHRKMTQETSHPVTPEADTHPELEKPSPIPVAGQVLGGG